MMDDQKEWLQKLPGVDRMLEDPSIHHLMDHYPRTMVIDKIREYLEALRQMILAGDIPFQPFEYETILDGFLTHTELSLEPSLKRAINGTGIVLHTGLGRAPFPKSAQDSLFDAVANYCVLQIDPHTGKRGDRYIHVESLLKKITGAEAAMVVNNNAAATLLILNTLAGGKEVIVSRGELVEIGGSFRVPDVMKRSGAKLVEIGTTNRTHLRDYRDAITPETGLILRVHQSNYRIVGFSKIVPLEGLVSLAHEARLPIVDDLGSGALVDLSRWGLPKEPTVQESIRAGSDVVCFSGDKLLGGPQCGVIVGKKEYIDRIKKNQLTRALRSCKMTFAVLEATLRLYLDEETLCQHHPVLKMLTDPVKEIKKRCYSLKRRLKDSIGDHGEMAVVEDRSEVGSGSLAAETLPTWSLVIQIQGLSAEELAKRLRLSNPPVFGRVKDDGYRLDCRTIPRDEFGFIVDAMKRLLLSSHAEEMPEKSKNVAENIIREVREIDESPDESKQTNAG